MIIGDFKFILQGRTLVIVDWANVHGWYKTLRWNVDPQRLFSFLTSHSEIFESRLYFGVEKGKVWSETFQHEVSQIGYTLVSKEVKYVPVSLDQSHFRSIVKNLFDVLDEIKNTNTEIATRLYEIHDQAIQRLAEDKDDVDVDHHGVPFAIIPACSQRDGEIHTAVYSLVEELDGELKKLNINITDLQKSLREPVMRRKCDFDVEITRDALNFSSEFETLILFSGDGDYAAVVEDLISKGKKVILVFAPGHKGKEYETIKQGLFQCPVNKMKASIAVQQNIPPDFSEGRDVQNIAQKNKGGNRGA